MICFITREGLTLYELVRALRNSGSDTPEWIDWANQFAQTAGSGFAHANRERPGECAPREE